MTAPCSHGMPTPAACFTCMEDGNLGIHVGQTIDLMSNGTYLHGACTP